MSVHPFFQERSFVSQTFLLPSCVFIQRTKCNILPLFPLIHIQRSTFHRRSPVPLSLQNGKLATGFLFVQLLFSFPFLIRLSASLLQSHRVARSRESDKILADSNPAGICGPVNPHTQDSHRQRTCSSWLFPFSPERETCCRLSVRATFVFLPLFKKTFRFTPAIPLGCTVSRI